MMKTKEIIEEITQLEYHPKVEKLSHKQKNYIIWMFKKIILKQNQEFIDAVKKLKDDSKESIKNEILLCNCKLAEDKAEEIINMKFKALLKEVEEK